MPNVTEQFEDHSALLVAADEGEYEIAKLLLEHDANPNYRNDSGESVLGCAITSKNVELIKQQSFSLWEPYYNLSFVCMNPRSVKK